MEKITMFLDRKTKQARRVVSLKLIGKFEKFSSQNHNEIKKVCSFTK